MTTMFFISCGALVQASELTCVDHDAEVVVYSVRTDRGVLFFEVPTGTDLGGVFKAARVAYEEEV